MTLDEARKKYGRMKIRIAEDGRPMVVIRPENPRLALAIADVAQQRNDGDLFARLPSEAGDYRFVGYAPEGKTLYVVDRDGVIVDELQSGDSFVTLNENVYAPPSRENLS